MAGLLRKNTIHAISEVESKVPSVSYTELSPSPIEHIEKTRLYSKLVLSPAFITEDFDLLRFEAAAHGQLPVTNGQTSTTIVSSDPGSNTKQTDAKEPPLFEYSTFLISSPYNSVGHYLDLSTLPTTSLLFAKALTALKPLRPDYATASYTESLNFSTVLEVLRHLSANEGVSWRETSFYVVVFRSKLKPTIDKDWLYKLDSESHREACESGGLLKYWFGKTDDANQNLATCTLFYWASFAN